MIETQTLPFIDPVQFGNSERFLDAQLFTIHSAKGKTLQVSNYGARMIGLFIPNRSGVLENLIIGFDNIEDYYTKNTEFFGAVIGPFANRIAQASFKCENQNVQCKSNEKSNLLHSGEFGIHLHKWKLEKLDKNEILLSTKHKEKSSGYPGNIDISVSYKFDELDDLVVSFTALSDKDTHINLSFHPYYNLSGIEEHKIENHFLKINADEFIPVDKKMIPLGEIRNAKNTIFDFGKSIKIGNKLFVDDPQLKLANGYDHCFVLNGGKTNADVELYCEESGREIKMYTTEPGIQLYTGNFKSFKLKDRTVGHRTALCIEPQHYPDSPNQKDFPSTLLKAKNQFNSKTRLTFNIR